MTKNLRDETKRLLSMSKLSYRVISNEADVPYGALQYFATRGTDMKSDLMQKLYEYLSGQPLFTEEHEG